MLMKPLANFTINYIITYIILNKYVPNSMRKYPLWYNSQIIRNIKNQHIVLKQFGLTEILPYWTQKTKFWLFIDVNELNGSIENPEGFDKFYCDFCELQQHSIIRIIGKYQ